MKNRRTYYQLILDRSGSMYSCIEQTINGVNQQILRIKELAARFPEQELVTSLTLFNHHITPTWTRKRPEKLREIGLRDYQPDGTTALLDAIGVTLHDLQTSIGPEVARDEASVVVVIITDGYENSSKRFSHGQISSLIRELELTGKWTFSYLGATADAVEIAMSMNISKSNAMSFNIEESDKVYSKVNRSLDDYMEIKRAGSIKKIFLDDQDDDAPDHSKN